MEKLDFVARSDSLYYMTGSNQVLFSVTVNSEGRSRPAAVANVEGTVNHVGSDHDGASARAKNSGKS